MHRIEDQEGWRTALHYLRTRNGREADFLVVIDGKPALLLEAKWRDDEPSSHFRFFAGLFPQVERVWLVAQPVRKRSLPDGTLVRNAPNYLARFDIPRGVRPRGSE